MLNNNNNKFSPRRCLYNFEPSRQNIKSFVFQTVNCGGLSTINMALSRVTFFARTTKNDVSPRRESNPWYTNHCAAWPESGELLN